MSDYNPNVLDAHEDGEDHPGNEKALAPLHGSNQEQCCTDESKEGIKDSVLDEGSNTDIPTLTLFSKQLDILGKLDNIERGRNHCDGKLYHSNIKDCCFQWNA